MPKYSSANTSLVIDAGLLLQHDTAERSTLDDVQYDVDDAGYRRRFIDISSLQSLS